MANAYALADLLLAAFSDTEIELLREDPEDAIDLVVPEVTVEVVDHFIRSDCGVEGEYHNPTRHITVQRAASFRRTKFTALHELGHDQAQHHPDVALAIARQPHNRGRTFEEAIANAFAASILIPDDVVDAVLDAHAPTADAVIELFHDDRVAGSREACCYRVARRMTGNGYVLLAQDNYILFCAPVGIAYTVARGAIQDNDHIIVEAGARGRATGDDVRLRHASGATTSSYGGQAVADDDGYVFAVLTDATKLPWGGWRPPSTPGIDAPEIDCPECDAVSEAWQRCDTNPAHRVCSACGWCACRQATPKVAERLCPGCGLLRRVDLFPQGSTNCRDCD